MKVNHMIIGAANVSESVAFYRALFDFNSLGKCVDTGTGKEGEILSWGKDKKTLQLFIVPFHAERLPNPQHIALETSREHFLEIYNKALTNNIPTRKNSSLHDVETGVGLLNTELNDYRIFYITDPSNINLEIMCLASKFSDANQFSKDDISRGIEHEDY